MRGFTKAISRFKKIAQLEHSSGVPGDNTFVPHLRELVTYAFSNPMERRIALKWKSSFVACQQVSRFLPSLAPVRVAGLWQTNITGYAPAVFSFSK
jgi:hypothetical protein